MKHTLHLVRPGHTPAVPLVATDTVVYMEAAGYRVDSPAEPEPIDAHELVRRLFTADLIITW